mmetsp:Transcript_48692/g.110266  ORF Transcript_48692/g.110266 Transcript_48692/m.110266 type:complete len:276 (+) Transcript_48692:603-1430(+)
MYEGYGELPRVYEAIAVEVCGLDRLEEPCFSNSVEETLQLPHRYLRFPSRQYGEVLEELGFPLIAGPHVQLRVWRSNICSELLRPIGPANDVAPRPEVGYVEVPVLAHRHSHVRGVMPHQSCEVAGVHLVARVLEVVAPDILIPSLHHPSDILLDPLQGAVDVLAHPPASALRLQEAVLQASAVLASRSTLLSIGSTFVAPLKWRSAMSFPQPVDGAQHGDRVAERHLWEILLKDLLHLDGRHCNGWVRRPDLPGSACCCLPHLPPCAIPRSLRT